MNKPQSTMWIIYKVGLYRLARQLQKVLPGCAALNTQNTPPAMLNRIECCITRIPFRAGTAAPRRLPRVPLALLLFCWP